MSSPWSGVCPAYTTRRIVELQEFEGRCLGRRLPCPTAGCPFFTKAHETLTRRPGGSSVSVSRLRRRPAYHSPNGLVEAVLIARGLPGSRPPPSPAVVVPFPKGSVRGALPEGAFSEVALASRFLPAYRDTVNPQTLASILEAVRQSSTCCAGLPKRFGPLNPRATPLRTVQRLYDTSPLPDYEPGSEGSRRSIPSPR